MPNHYAGDLRRTLAISGLSHVRTELPHLLVIPFLTPHPVESNREFPRHCPARELAGRAVLFEVREKYGRESRQAQTLERAASTSATCISATWYDGSGATVDTEQ